MFDFFRNNIKVLMGLLVLLIIPSFVLFGIEGYTRFQEQDEPVATIGKLNITQPEWDAAHRTEVDRMAAQMPGIDRKLLDSPEARAATLERMMIDRVLALAAQDNHLLVTDQRLAKELSQDPTIAGLRRADGSLDMEQYRQILRSQGLTPEAFENNIRAEMIRRQITQGVARSVFVPTASAKVALDAYFQQREIQLVPFSPQQFRSKVSVSGEEIEQFYKDNTTRFQTPEQASIEYLVLNLDAVAKTIKLSEADVRAYYEQNAAAQTQKEERRASHILLTVDPGMSAEKKAEVKAAAAALLDEVKRNPAKFAELAKTRSQDPGSAARGGDLDFFARGAMVKPFEDAVFALNKGEISSLVESDFGYHIIQLTDIRRPAVQSFEAMKPQLEAELIKQQAQKRYAEVAEEFSNLVYEQSDSFDAAAKKLGLNVKQATRVQRNGPQDPAADPLLRNPKLLEAAFTEEATRNKRNSEALEVAPSTLVSVRVTQHQPAAVEPLEAVKDKVQEQLIQNKALALAKEQAAASLKAWQAVETAPGLSTSVVFSRLQPQGLPVPVMQAALAAEVPESGPGWTQADLGPAGVAVVKVNRVLPRTSVQPEQAKAEAAQLGQLWTRAETLAYVEYLKSHYKAKVVTKKSE